MAQNDRSDVADEETASTGGIVALGARLHLFVTPAERSRFIYLFRDALKCAVTEIDFGLDHPILLVTFADGSAFSVEFSELAHKGGKTAIDDESAFRGAWIEFRTSDVEGNLKKLRAAGVPEFKHAGSPHVYFAAPGGQVFRLLDIAYKGP